MSLEEMDMKIRYDTKIDAAVDFEEHGEMVGFEIIDASNYLGFSHEYPNFEVKTFKVEKVKNAGRQKPFRGAFSINKNMRN